MAVHPPLTLATLELTAEGLPYSGAYGDIYHSRAGGLGQAEQVFLHGNGLPERWQQRTCFTILETGFGLGLNFLATWSAWKADPARCRRLHFISVEKHPFTRDDLHTLHQAWPELAPLAERLQRQWPVLTAGFHRLQLDEGVALTLILGDALEWLPRLNAEVDAFYLDGFAPGRNPELWCPALFRQIARLAHPQASCATYTVAAVVRQGLQTAGFSVEKRPGFGGKRDRLEGRYTRNKPRHLASRPAEQAIVVGAGLAGSSIAHRLAARGWQVLVVDRHEGPAQEASGNRAGILHPVLSRDDNLQSRLSRACFDYALRHLVELPQEFAWARCGVLQVAADADEEERQREIIAALRLPDELAIFLNREQASARCGQTLDRGGWYFPDGAWVQPPALCTSQLKLPSIRTSYGLTVDTIRRVDGSWQILDTAGEVLAAAPVLILANASDAARLLPPLPLQPLRRQISHIPAAEVPALDVVLCGDAYLTPAVEGFACLGASRDDAGLGLRPTEAAHRSNLDKLRQLLPELGSKGIAIDAARLEGRVGYRPTTPDRLPLVGALPAFDIPPRGGTSQLHQIPRQEGLYGLLGFGARGLTWSALCAELLASQIGGEPLPLDKELVGAVDPGRFWLRELRQLT